MKKTILLSLVIMLSGCSTIDSAYTKSTVTGSHIENRTIGFKGFSLKRPSSYMQFTPSETGLNSTDNAQKAWDLSSRYDRRSGNACERIAFQKGDFGITFAIVWLDDAFVTKPNKAALRDYLNRLARIATANGKGGDLNDVIDVGDRVAGRSGRALSDKAQYITLHQTLLPPRYMLVVNGACPLGKEKELLSDIETALSSLTYE